jgi:Glycoside Hydrolase Family 113
MIENCSFAQIAEDATPRINGLSLVSMNSMFETTQVDPILKLNANWVAVIPYAIMSSKNKPELSFDVEWQWIGERSEGIRRSIQILHEQGLSAMVKPQLWVGHGEFSGHVIMRNEEDWIKLEEGFKEYILTFAVIAEEEGAEMMCIGTELNRFVSNRPLFWSNLIDEVRKVYSGKLTYAENWDSYENVDFWGKLDFIGVDAYFPIARGKQPSKSKLIKGWKKIEVGLDSLASMTKKQIIFTEYGYRNILGCAKAPWDYGRKGERNENAQVKALLALYDVMWNKDYFVGGFLWKWYPDHLNAGGKSNDLYTVQNKKAEITVREQYGRN